MEKKILLIVNPVAGNGHIEKDINKIIGNFQKSGYEVEVQFTTENHSAEKIVEDKAINGEIIVAVGGDGTLNEVVNGILKNDKSVNLGFIPFGTTNDFARSLNIPTDKYILSKHINSTVVKKCDIGLFNNTFFNYVSAFGTFAKTSFSTKRELKNKFGRLAYLSKRHKRFY